MSNRINKYWITAGATFIVLLFSVWPGNARAADRSIADWQMDVTITKDGICQFQEVRSYDFIGQTATVVAQWPVIVGGAIQDFTVTDESGNIITRESSPILDSHGTLRYNLPVQTTTGKQSWRVAYNVTRCVSYFDNHDQMDWPISLSTRAEEIKHLLVNVHLPRPAAFLDRFSQSLTISTAAGWRDLNSHRLVDAQTIQFDSASLPAKSGIRLLASWPKDVLDDPGTLKVIVKGINGEALDARLSVGGMAADMRTPHVFRITNPALASEVISLTVEHFGYQAEQRELVLVRGKSEIFSFELLPAWWYQPFRYGLAGLILILWVSPWWAWYRWYGRWRRSGRDPKTTKLIDPALGPGKLTPSELGVIVDERVDRSDLTAGIVFLAVHRFLAIERLAGNWGRGQRDFNLIKLDKNTQSLGSFEQSLLKWLFELGPAVNLSSLADGQVSKLKNLTSALYDQVALSGYFAESPAVVRRRYVRRPINWLIGSLALNLSALVSYPSLFIIVLPLLILSVMALLFASIMPKKTLKGAEVAHWSKRYIAQLIDDSSQPTRTIERWEYERALPFLLVLEADAMWLSAHGDSLKEWPSWLKPIDASQPYVASHFIQLYNQFIEASDTVFKSI